MADTVTVFNPGGSPLTFDTEGRQVVPGDWAGAVDRSFVAAHLEAGRLIVVDDPRDADGDASLNPAARDALDATAKANKGGSRAKAKTPAAADTSATSSSSSS